jgi:hypothetical protein
VHTLLDNFSGAQRVLFGGITSASAAVEPKIDQAPSGATYL